MNRALKDFHVVLVGCGRMGTALIAGAVNSGVVQPNQLSLVDKDPARATALADQLGGSTTVPAEGPRLFVLAMKPNQLKRAVSSMQLSSDDVLLSVAAGIRAKHIEEWVGAGPRVVRCMPNTPALVGAGITGVHFGHARVPAIATLLEGVGAVVELQREQEFDALTAISGSGPAFMFTAIEALADGGVLMGLDRKTASALAIQTVIGAGKLAADSPDHTAELKDQVASPGGTTIAGLEALEKAGFRAAIISAVRAAAERSRELGEKLS